MKIQSTHIVLDKKVYYSGDLLTGKVVIKTNGNWPDKTFAFIKFFDDLELDWHETDDLQSLHQNHPVQMVHYPSKIHFKNIQRPYKVNQSVLFDKNDLVRVVNDDHKEGTYIYPFLFQISPKLQSSITIKHAKCSYFIKAFLTNDESIAEYYKPDIDIFSEPFKNLDHLNHCKQEVIIKNQTYTPCMDIDHNRYTFEGKSNHIKATINLPKVVYSSGETVPIHVLVEPLHIDHYNSKHMFNLNKIVFKLIEIAHITAVHPLEKTKTMTHTIEHTNRRHLHENNHHTILIEEYFSIPNVIHSSSSFDSNSNSPNPIKIQYKFCLQFWKGFLSDELDIEIPIAIDPECD